MGLNHGQLAVFRRERSLFCKERFDRRVSLLDGFWDLDNPLVWSIEENSSTETGGTRSDSIDEENTSTGVSIITLVAGRLWCVIRDRIFIVCPNSFVVQVKKKRHLFSRSDRLRGRVVFQHSFVVDDCHRPVLCLATGGSSMHHVWIASQGSQDIRLYHATHFTSLLEINIRTAVTQRLQGFFSSTSLRHHRHSLRFQHAMTSFEPTN